MSAPSPQSEADSTLPSVPATAAPAPKQATGTAARASRQPARTDVSRLPFKWSLTGCTREGELYRRVVRLLRQHLGGKVSPAQALLIGRIAWMQVHLAHIDERAMKEGGLSPHSVREYLAWSNSIGKLLRQLGLAATPVPGPTLDEIIAALPDRKPRQPPAAGAAQDGPSATPRAPPEPAQAPAGMVAPAEPEAAPSAASVAV